MADEPKQPGVVRAALAAERRAVHHRVLLALDQARMAACHADAIAALGQLVAWCKARAEKIVAKGE